ncbi:histidine phosphatase family protein [Natronoarchaeum sp. GCM10025703]|uniref:histidine phosphatase family protein n=1 Tax=Natronoarchaeum sp. GCM10025703 TaxID=3252685 RepID=UPI00361E6678
MGTVVLVRHGETEWNDEQRVQGWAPVGLNERGRVQGPRSASISQTGTMSTGSLRRICGAQSRRSGKYGVRWTSTT